MYRKDLILKETQRLIDMLARLMGLKNSNLLPEAQQLATQSVTENFGLNTSLLVAMSDNAFDAWISEKKLSADHLNALAQLLYYCAAPWQQAGSDPLAARKALKAFTLLEQQYHIQSFENLGMINELNQIINN